jgi:glycosyltransferase involved in cell wall biosynthesis
VLLRELAPDVERTIGEFGTHDAAVAETRLARALYQAYGTRPSLLLDLRNIVTGMNGTTIAALGISAGLHALHADWDVTLLTSRDACAFHKLEASFPDWRVVTKLPARQFTVALRLSQPWHIQEMIDLHAAASFNAYVFLDTISWDAAYPAPKQLDGTWQFMADHADALLFISDYTRDRFHRRFAVPAATPELVSYLSFDPAEYVRSDARVSSNRESFIFIVGNEYDHKDVGPTVDLLATAFPYESLIALGPAAANTPRIKVLKSGALPEAEIHRLYAGARLVVFPSFYEGFGFPILTTLAYGGTVVARHSALLEEIAARSVPGGRIVPFVRRDELVEVVGRLLHGEAIASLPLGAALENGRPISWQGVGERILAFLATLSADLSGSRWRARAHTIAQLMAAPTSLVDQALKTPCLHADLPST